jgi:hypothetical protein
MSAPDSELMSYVVRMVIPIKREFGRSVDVHQFLHDLPYAKEVIELALSSNDQRLNNYAAYLDTKMFGPRGTNTPLAAEANAAVADANPSKTTAQAAPAATDGDKAAAMEKYKTRLR